MFSSPLSCLLYSLYIFLGTRDPSLYLVVSSIGVVASLELITEIRELEDRSQDGSREEEIKHWRFSPLKDTNIWTHYIDCNALLVGT